MDWEYKVLTHSYVGDLEKVLNLLGDKGWELVTCGFDGPFAKAVLKRPILMAEVIEPKEEPKKCGPKIDPTKLMSQEDILVHYLKYSPEEAKKIAQRAKIQKLEELKLQVMAQNPALSGAIPVPEPKKQEPETPVWGKAKEWVEFKKPECEGCKDKEKGIGEALKVIKDMKEKLAEESKKYSAVAQDQFDAFKKAVYEGTLGQALQKMWYKPEQK